MPQFFSDSIKFGERVTINNWVVLSYKGTRGPNLLNFCSNFFRVGRAHYFYFLGVFFMIADQKNEHFAGAHFLSTFKMCKGAAL